MKEDRALTFLDGADRLIEKATSIIETIDIIATSKAVGVWAKRSRKGPIVIGKAMGYQIRAERRLGEILREMKARGERDSGGKGRRIESQKGIQLPTLADLGVTAKESSRAQKMALAPAAVFEKAIGIARARLSFSSALKAVKEAEKERKKETVEEIREAKIEGKDRVLGSLEDGFGKFGCIYADPPWSYGDNKCGGGTEFEYPTMTVEDIAALPVGELAEEAGAHLWMWTTWPMIRDKAPHRVLEGWGFRWVGEIVWFKGERLGVGRWLRPSTEILILAEKKKKGLERYNQRGHVFECPRGRHSVKPIEFYKIIESLSSGPYLELFSRPKKRDLVSEGYPPAGWYCWGNEEVKDM